MEADFDVQVREGHVEVIFRPTESHISFGILVDPKDIARLAVSLALRTFDMPRQAIPAITPQARWKLWPFGWLPPPSATANIPTYNKF
jgi:hypothetical protein